MTAALDPRTAARMAAYRVVARRHGPARRSYPWESDWRAWMDHVFPELAHFAPHHAWFWERIWAMQPGVKPRPLVALWPRGGAKSSSAEMAAVALGCLGKRRYGLYVSGTQPKAEEHLDAIAAILESPQLARDYPAMSERAVNKYGNSRGWRRSRLTTASGFVMDAAGLDTDTRGVKFENQRPDFIIVDDVDKLHDSPEVIQKKIDTLTKTLLPAGSTDLAVIAIQNLITSDGLFARLAPDTPAPADFLLDRDVSGPVPAVLDLEYTEVDDPASGRRLARIVGGTPAWDGQNLATCEAQMNEWGIDAFLAEAQHQPRARGEKLYRREWWDGINRYRTDDHALLSTAVGRFMSWDTAESESATSAWTACVTGDLVPYRGGYAVLIREVWRDRVELPALLDALVSIGLQWGFDVPRRNLHTGCIVEYASSGKAVVQAARSNVTSLRVNAPDWLKRCIRPFVPRVPKDQRAMQAARFCRAGRVLLPEPGPDVPWLVAFEEELFSLPASTYRDQTDAFAQLIIALSGRIREPGQRAPVTGDDGL